MPLPRDVLNEIAWRDGLGRLDGARITVRHRGAPRDEAVVGGEDVRHVGHGYLELDDARIPYHRVLRIELGGQLVWDRRRDGLR